MKVKNKGILILLIVIVFAVFVFTFGGQLLLQKSNNSSNTGKIDVVTSLYPLYYFASVVGGDHAHVINITPAGVEAHEFEPTTQDVVKIQHSDLLLLNGHIEVWAPAMQKNLIGKDVEVLVINENLFAEHSTDPHVWLSPELAQHQVAIIAEAFKKEDPKNASYYQKNADELIASLQELDSAYRQGLATCQKRDIVTAHAAFGYLAQEYNLNQVAISGLSPEEEPSARKLAELATFVREKQVKYIFFEELTSPRFSQTLAQETGVETLVLNPAEGLTPEDEAKGENYFTIMEANLANLEKALVCN